MKLLQALNLILTIRCEEADRIRALQRAGETAWHERLAMTLHTWICRGCWNAARQARVVDDLLDDDAERPAPPASDDEGLTPAARQRLQAKLDAARNKKTS